jgi:hypothetical protein
MTSPQPSPGSIFDTRGPHWFGRILFTVLFCIGAATVPAIAQQLKAGGPGKAVIAFRIGTARWESKERFDEVLRLFDRYQGVTDEISFFHSTTHAPLPLEEVRRRAAILSERMQQARKRGYRAGINVLTTIGHHEENLPNSLQGDYTPMTDPIGNICKGSFCPNDENMRNYIRQLYELIAGADPDFIWLDDDLRLAGHMPIGLTCFCDHCLEIFSAQTATSYTRDELGACFVTGDYADRIKLRKAWIQHNRNTFDRTLRLIEKTVHSEKPGLSLGFMTGERVFEGRDHDHWAKVLAGPSRAPVRWRPGGGFYQDARPGELAEKSHTLGRQVSLLSTGVGLIQSEIENFPYQPLYKSARLTRLEAAAHIAAGCTGAAFNVLSMEDNAIDEYEPMISQLHQARPFFDLMVQRMGRRPLTGIYPAWGRDAAATMDPEGGNWYAAYDFLAGRIPEFVRVGLPVAYGPQHATVTLFSDDNANAFSDEKLKQILAGGVYMDAKALATVNARGLGHLTGFTCEHEIGADGLELLTDHPLNGPYSGYRRDCRQSFSHDAATAFGRSSEQAKSLARLVDYREQELAACAMGVFENTLGGRICVAGYFPWGYHGTTAKSLQIKSILRWLSRDTLPSYVASFHRINLWQRQCDSNQVALAMLNGSFDSAQEVTLMLKTTHQQLRVTDTNLHEETVTASGNDGEYRRFVIPQIGPWDIRLVTN